MARACFFLAVTSVCLWVYFACQVQRKSASLYTFEQIKEWLILPPPDTVSEGVKNDWQSALLVTILIFFAPFAVAKLSILSFLVGLAVYRGFIFSKELDTNAAHQDSRDNSILLILGTGLYLPSSYTILRQTYRKRLAITIGRINGDRMILDPSIRQISSERLDGRKASSQ